MDKTIASMPKETVAELLYFLAENERFSSVTAKLKGGVTVPQVRGLLREVARSISDEALVEASAHEHEGTELSTKTKDVISSLTAEEGQKLMAAFGLK
jgi:hypothetical protein